MKYTPKLERGVYRRVHPSEYTGTRPLPKSWGDNLRITDGNQWNGKIDDNSWIYVDDDNNWIPSDVINDKDRWEIYDGYLVDRYKIAADDLKSRLPSTTINGSTMYYMPGANSARLGPTVSGNTDLEFLTNYDRLLQSDYYEHKDPTNNALNWLLFGGAALSRMGLSTALEPLASLGDKTYSVASNLATKYLTPGARLLIPKLITSYFAAEGGENLLSEDGVAKTVNLIKNREYGNAAVSGLGDALDASFVMAAVPGGVKGTLNTAGKAAHYLAANTLPGTTLKFDRALDMRALAKAVNEAKINVPELLLNVGWAPKLTINVAHASNTNEPLSIFSSHRWDVINEGANPHGIWYQGKLGTPRTELTNPGKGVKAQAARDLFANRPYLRTGVLTLNKPMTTVGEVSDRSALSWYADQAGADGIIYNGVYDNGFNNNQVILSFVKHDPELYRPLTFMEKLGIPKGDRGNMSRFLLDALEDATRKLSPQYPGLDANGNFYWSTTPQPGVIQRIVNMPGARIRNHANDGVSISWKTDNGFYDFKQNPDKQLAQFSTKYQEELPNGDFVGDASMISTPKDIKIFITSPKAEGGISETVDPQLMKNFWTALEGVSKSGLYISGDHVTLPLGSLLRTTLENIMKPIYLGNGEVKQLTTTRYQDFINQLMTKPVYKTHSDGLSADAYEAILKLANRPDSKYNLRFSSNGMESFNSLTAKNIYIYDLLELAKLGLIPKELFISEFNNWVKPYGGMNAKILEDGTIWIPQPFLMRKKNGGKLIKNNDL